MSSNRILLDGQYARGVYVGRAVVSYPFLRNGDRSAIIVQRQFRVRESSYMPGQIGVERDPRYPIAYLAAESDPVPAGVSDLIQVVRTFASVPADQVTYGSRVITKPDAASTGGVSVGQFYGEMSPVAGLGIAHTYASYLFAPTGKVYGSLISCTSSNSGANTRLEFSSAHGIAGTETLVSRGASGSSNFGVLDPADYSVIDADTIDILGFNAGANATQVGKYLRDYTPGTDRVGIKITQKLTCKVFFDAIEQQLLQRHV